MSFGLDATANLKADLEAESPNSKVFEGIVKVTQERSKRLQK